jgi:dTDP-4-amino-4,6-dideoxygalactose transaminase
MFVGRGCRLDELRAAILRVQLKKLPTITAHMRWSKYRIRRELEKYPQLRLCRIIDTEGDTGCFLIVSFDDPETAMSVNQALRAEGIVTSSQGVNNVVMTDWGLHIYTNIMSLMNKTAVDEKGFPWTLAENQDSKPNYAKGTCSAADSLFERSLLLAIPSCLTEQDEDQIIQAFEKVLSHFPVPA